MGSLAKATLLFHLRTPTSHNRRNAYVKTSNELVENMVEFKLHPRRYIWNNGQFKSCEDRRSKRGCLSKVNAFPDWHVMAVLVQHMEGQRDLITHKSIWHLNDETIKNVYTIYVMFTCWGCCFFGAMKDPYYDSEEYRGEGGDGTGHWVYEKQEDIEESNRAELWREELIEEIEQKVGGLRELEEAGKKEELVK